MSPQTFFHNLWRDYISITPQAQQIHALLKQHGETIVNDHVAFRTFNQKPIDIESLEPLILSLGYQRFAPYEFPDRKLRAFGYVHADSTLPRIFLSELLSEQLSILSHQIIDALVSQIDISQTEDLAVFWKGRMWAMPSWSQYQTLLQESDYAAWLGALGLRANHFTVSINHLTKLNELRDVLDVVKQAGFALNTSDGEIKGSPEVLLEQGSTVADTLDMEFAGGDRHPIATCYYEFAKRYPQPDGTLYNGFVAASADKLFESTDLH